MGHWPLNNNVRPPHQNIKYDYGKHLLLSPSEDNRTLIAIKVAPEVFEAGGAIAQLYYQKLSNEPKWNWSLGGAHLALCQRLDNTNKCCAHSIFFILWLQSHPATWHPLAILGSVCPYNGVKHVCVLNALCIQRIIIWDSHQIGGHLCTYTVCIQFPDLHQKRNSICSAVALLRGTPYILWP